MKKRYKNLKTGSVIEWDDTKGRLIESVWREYGEALEPQFDTVKVHVEPFITFEELEKRKAEEVELVDKESDSVSISVEQVDSMTEEVDVVQDEVFQPFNTLREAKVDADETRPIIVRNKDVYDFIDGTWVKRS